MIETANTGKLYLSEVNRRRLVITFRSSRLGDKLVRLVYGDYRAAKGDEVPTLTVREARELCKLGEVRGRSLVRGVGVDARPRQFDSGRLHTYSNISDSCLGLAVFSAGPFCALGVRRIRGPRMPSRNAAIPARYNGPMAKVDDSDDPDIFADLNDREAAFVLAYTGEHFARGAASYRAAGYTCKNTNVAAVGAAQLLMKPKIRDAVDAIMAADEKMDDAATLRQWWREMREDEEVGHKDRLKASELSARVLGMFVDRHEITGKDGGPVVVEVPARMTVEEWEDAGE